MKRLVALTALVVCLALSASAQNGKAQGYCSAGGYPVNLGGFHSTVPIGGNSTTNGAGKVLASFPGCTVTVYLTGTLTLATIFSDSGGTAKANPFTADSTSGLWFFYASQTVGNFDVKMSGGGIPSPFTLSDIAVNGVGGGSGGGGSCTGISSTIQAAITTAGAGGCVTISPTYAGTDVYTNPNNIQIIDLRASADRWRGFINALTDCGLPYDGVTDASTKLNTCIANNKGKTIWLPKTHAWNSSTPDYYFSSPITLTGDATILRGEGKGQSNTTTGSTHFRFVSGIAEGINLTACGSCGIFGLELEGQDSYATSSSAGAILPAVSCNGSSYGTGITGTSTSDGIVVSSTFAHIQDNLIYGFGRFGLRINGNSVADNADVSNNVFTGNRGSGICNSGSDSNAHTFYQNGFYNNQIYGIEDYSFLGDTVIAPQGTLNHADTVVSNPAHTNSSLQRSSNVVTAVTTTAHGYSVGHCSVISGADSGFNGTFFVATTPTTTSYTYAQTGSNATSSAAGVSTQGTATQCWTAAGLSGGDYKFSGGAVNSVIIMPYSEGGSGGSNSFAPNQIVIGGAFGSAIDYSANPSITQSSPSGGWTFTPFTVQDHVRTVGGAGANSKMYLGAFQHTGASADVWGAQDTAGSTAQYGIWFGLLSVGAPFYSTEKWFRFGCCQTSEATSAANNSLLLGYGQTPSTSGNVPLAWLPNGFFFGNNSVANTRELWRQNTGTAPVDSQTQGSLDWRANATSGSYQGWVNTSAGTGTTWKAWGPISKDVTGTEWSLPTIDVTNKIVNQNQPTTSWILANSNGDWTFASDTTNRNIDFINNAGGSGAEEFTISVNYNAGVGPRMNVCSLGDADGACKVYLEFQTNTSSRQTVFVNPMAFTSQALSPFTPDVWVSEGKKTLTDGAATTLVSGVLASGTTWGGEIKYNITVTDGTNSCSISGYLSFSSENTGGTFVKDVTKVGTESKSCTATKDIATVFSVTAANPALIQVTPTLTGITATSFTATYLVTSYGQRPTI